MRILCIIRYMGARGSERVIERIENGQWTKNHI